MSKDLKAKLRARREQMRETATADGSESEGITPRQPTGNETWGAAMEETGEGGASASSPSEATGDDDESKDTEALMSNLKKRRKKAKEDLEEGQIDKAKAADEDLKTKQSEMKRKMQQRMREKAAKAKQAAAGASEETEPLSRDESDSLRSSANNSTMADTATSKSMTTKSKMKERLTAKIRAAQDTARDEAKATGRKLAGLRSAQRSTRFDDAALMKKEDLEVEDKLERSMTARKKFKETAEKTKTLHLPSPQEAYDFFTTNFDPEPEEAPAGPAVETGEGADDEEAGPSGEGAGAEGPTDETEESETPTADRKKKKVPTATLR